MHFEPPYNLSTISYIAEGAVYKFSGGSSLQYGVQNILTAPFFTELLASHLTEGRISWKVPQIPASSNPQTFFSLTDSETGENIMLWVKLWWLYQILRQQKHTQCEIFLALWMQPTWARSLSVVTFYPKRMFCFVYCGLPPCFQLVYFCHSSSCPIISLN